MTKFVVGAGVALDMSAQVLDFDGDVTASPTHIHIDYGNDSYNDIDGQFEYDRQGNVTGGTVTGLSETEDGKLIYTATGASIDAPTFADLVRNEDVKGAQALAFAGNDKLVGAELNDHLYGLDGKDSLSGGKGDDILEGNAGKDKLDGGRGADTLTGGKSADLFIYDSAKDSTVKAAGRDHITDFSHKQHDRIDLHAIDAVKGGRDDKFTFIGDAAFHKVAGELHVAYGKHSATVSGDIDGNGKADFAIVLDHVTSAHPLVAADFVL